MDDFEIEDGSFYNWEPSSPSVDYSSILNSLPELSTPDAGIFDSLSKMFSNVGESLDLSNLFSTDPTLLSMSDAEMEDFLSSNYLKELEAAGGNIENFIGDQPGDYTLGEKGTTFGGGLADVSDVENIMGKETFDDGSYVFKDITTGQVVSGADANGREFEVNAVGEAVYSDTGEPVKGQEQKTFGGKLADKTDVDALLKYNAAIANGGYPVQNKDGSVTVKDKNGRDLFTVGNDGKITPTTTTTTTPTTKTPVTPGKISNNAALLAALFGGLLGLAGTPKTGGAKGYMAGAGAGGSHPLTATRTALSPTGAPGAGGKRFLSDVTYAAEGGLMGLGYQPNQNVTFMATGGIAGDSDYLDMGRGLSVGDLRKADFLVRSGMSPDSAASNYSKVPDGMARGGISSLGSYSDGGRMLKGPGDGMSDDIPATIGGKRPARLADGEFVVSADVVSGLGNGSTDAGAEVLYGMMDRVRKARTGTKKQGKQINPSKYVPR
jgi:hypothetical protein